MISAVAVRRRVAAALARTPLIAPAVRARELWRAATSPRGAVADAEGLPIPGPFLRVLVVGGTDADWFLETGREAVTFFETLLAEDGGSFANAESVLDFGCGCGRLARHLPAVTDARIVGRDVNARGVRWCARHLSGDFKQNGLNPPLDLDDASIDVGYALSVLTHLDGDTQRAWLAEWRRVLRPGGRFIATFHDERHVGLLPETAARVARDGFAVQSAGMEGSNHFASFQTRAALIAGGKGLFEPGPARASDETPFGQAAIVLRRID